MRYQSKEALRQDVRAEHDALVALLGQIPEERHSEPGVWGDGWSLTDLVAHLAEWQTMFLGWYEAGQGGAVVELPAPGYKWNETPRLNRAIREKHRAQSAGSVRAHFDRGYERILALLDGVSQAELLSPGHFRWTGRNALATYLGANSASHYRFARKVIERWRRHSAVPALKRPRPGDR
jgi:hypothetical protein